MICGASAHAGRAKLIAALPAIRFADTGHGILYYTRPAKGEEQRTESRRKSDIVIRNHHDYFTIIDSAISLLLYSFDQCSGLSERLENALFDRYLRELCSLKDFSELWHTMDAFKEQALNHLSDGNKYVHLSISGLTIEGIFSYIFNKCDSGWASVYKIACFISKTRITRPDQEQEQINKFLHYQKYELPSRLISSWALDLVTKLYRKHPLEYSEDAFLPKHGPGAVNPSVDTIWDKQQHFRLTRRNAYWLREDPSFPFLMNGRSYRSDFVKSQSKLCCVPKNWKKPRTIASEPISNQYLQQGLEHMLDYAISHDNWWSLRINLHDAERGARLSMQYRRYATIDCSSASDDVRKQHVQSIFKGTPWCTAFHAVRSDTCKVGKDEVKLESFSTMGSAICFPVETIIFTLTCQAACDLVGTDRHPCVYGDDMVVPVEAYELACHLLTSLGFQVNTEKSYGVNLPTYGWSGSDRIQYFREACGTHSFCGDRIPIVYFRESFIKKNFLEPQEYMSVVDTLNSMSPYQRTFTYFWKGSEESLVRGCRHTKCGDLIPFADLDTNTEYVHRTAGLSSAEIPRQILNQQTYLFHNSWYRTGVLVKRSRGKSIFSAESMENDREEVRYQAWLYDHDWLNRNSSYDFEITTKIVDYSSELSDYVTWLFRHRHKWKAGVDFNIDTGREALSRINSCIAAMGVDNTHCALERLMAKQWPKATPNEMHSTIDVMRGFRTHSAFTVIPKWKPIFES